MKILTIAKNLIKTGIFGAFLSLFIVTYYCHSEEFVSEKEKFSLKYDSSLIPADIRLHNVAMALMSKNGKFPTFNVVIEPGAIDLKAPIADKAKAILDSYRLVGITGARLLSSEDRIENGNECFKAELAYNMQGQNMRSFVAIFTGIDRHYILTFIDTEEGYNNSRKLALDIHSSFQLTSPTRPISETSEQLVSDYFPPVIFITLILIILIYIKLKKK